MTRKLASLLLALAMVLMMVPAVSATAEADIPVIDWYFGIGEAANPDWQKVNEAVNEYLAEQIGVNVNLHFWGAAEDWERMTTMIGAGQDCGIIGFGSQTKLDYVINSQRGGYYPLEDFLNSDLGAGTKALFSDGIWGAMTINGHIYGIPSLKDNGFYISMVYNKTMADELKLDVNEFEFNNFQDVTEWAYKVKAARDAAHPEMADAPVLWSSDGVHPYNFAVENFLNGSFFAVCNIPEIMQIKSVPDTETVFNIYATPEFKDYAIQRQKAVEDGIYLYDYTDKSEILYSGQVFANVGWGYTYFQKDMWGSAVETDGRMFDKMWTDTNNFFSAGTAISSKCANPEAAFKVLNLVNTDPKFATMMRFGIEGTHYTRDAEGKMTFEGTANNDRSNSLYYNWYMAPVGNLTIVEAPEGLVGPDNIMLKKMAQYNEECILAAHMGFVFDQNVVATEVAACISAEKEYYADLVKGQLADEDEVVEIIDELNAKLAANGLQTVIDEVVKQMEAWKAAQ